LVTGVKSYLKIKLQEIRKYYPDWEYIEIEIKKDHVHLTVVPGVVFNYPDHVRFVFAKSMEEIRKV